jgi:hypothetical protein
MQANLMQVRYELTPDDMIPISQEGQKGTDLHKVYLTIITILGLFFMMADMILLVVFVFLNDPTIQVPDIGPSLIIKLLLWIVVIGLFWAILMTVAKRGVKNALSKPGINGIFCEHLIEFDEDGFTESTAVNRAFHAWKGVDSVSETDNFVLITIRLGATHFIPKRSFESDAERSAFIAAVNDHIVSASVPLPPLDHEIS